MAWYFCFKLSVSVRPSLVLCISCLVDKLTGVNINGFSPNLVCALILSRSGLGLLMGKFRQIMTVICLGHAPFSFPGDNLSKLQCNFTKLGMCIDIVEICFGIANG